MTIRPGIIVILLLLPMLSLGQWLDVSIPGQTSNLKSVKFFNINSGLIFASPNKVLKTQDGGNTFQTTLTGANLSSLVFSTPSNWYGIQGSSTIRWTINSGTSWQVQTLAGNPVLSSIVFPCQDTGYCTADSGIIYKTTNAGMNWIPISLPTAFYLTQACFTSKDTGYVNAVSDNYVYSGNTIQSKIFKTTDGGNSWVQVFSNSSLYLDFIACSNKSDVFALGMYSNSPFFPYYDMNALWRSSNGGTTWTLHQFYSDTLLYALDVRNNGYAYICGDYGNIRKTVDGCYEWINQPTPTTSHLNALYFLDASHGFAVGSSGKIMKTSSGGFTTPIILEQPLGDVLNCGDFIYFSTNACGAEPLSYTWQHNGVPISSANNKVFRIDSITSSDSGTYSCIVSNSFGQVSTNTVNLKVYPLPLGNGWTWLNPLPHGTEFNHVQFINDTVGFAVSKNGTYSKTTDLWQHTTNYSFGPDVNLTSCYFTDNQHGTLIGNKTHQTKAAVIYTTFDGGLSWKMFMYKTNNQLTAVSYYGHDTAIVTGSSSLLFRTTNGGLTWALINTGYTSGFITAALVSPTIAYIYTEGSLTDGNYILKSLDAGLHWVKYNFPAWGNPVNACFFGVDTIFAIGMNHWELQNAGYIYKSVNGGLNWSISTGEYLQIFREYYEVDCLSPNDAIVLAGFDFSGNFCLRQTNNAGLTWTNRLIANGNDLRRIHYRSSDQRLFLYGTSGLIKSQALYGGPMTQHSSGFGGYIYTVDFPHRDTGYCAGASGKIYKTTDAGSSWTLSPNTSTQTIYGCSFISQGSGLFVGNAGTILRTTDGGNTVNGISCPVSTALKAVQWLNDSIAYVAGSSGIILKSEDGGTNWNILTPGIMTHLSSLFFINPLLGYVGGDNGTLLKTIDGGATWITLTTNLTSIVKSIYFINQDTGFIVSSKGYILRTFDGGSSWLSKYMTGGTALNSIKFSDQATGYAAGEVGKLFKTTDLGNTWSFQNSGTFSSLEALCFTQVDTGYVVGSGAVIMKTVNGSCGSSEVLPDTLNYKIDGYCYYDNDSSTPMSGTSLLFIRGNDTITTICDSSGKFELHDPPVGNYQIIVHPQIPWGGVNAVDAMLIMNHFVELSILSGLCKKAAYLNSDSIINATDAFLAMMRFVGLYTNPLDNDYVIDNPNLSFQYKHNLSITIRFLCVGDVNRSYLH